MAFKFLKTILYNKHFPTLQHFTRGSEPEGSIDLRQQSLSHMSSIFLEKAGDNSKPTVSYQTFARIQAMCSCKVLKYVIATTSLFLLLTAYYLYLDQKYLVDEILEGTKLRELTLKEKVTIRVVAPRHLEDLNKFVLDYSICQPVHEIQIIWLHEQHPPTPSYFKYQHTHSKVTFADRYGSTSYDALYSDVNAATQSVLLLDADVFIPCRSIAFAQSVWRSSQNSLVGAFPRQLQWEKDQAILSGWSSVVHRGQYSLMLPAAVLLRTEYLRSMTVPSKSEPWAAKAHKDLREYVNEHPHCADLAFPLWAVAITAHAAEVGKEVGGEGKIPVNSIKSVGENKVGDFFPVTSAPPPIWVDLPGIDIVGGVELTAYPTGKEVASRAARGATHPRSNELAPRKVVLSPEMSSACVTEVARLLGVGQKNIPVAGFKSTVASTHWVW